jgi:hypothetical protein
MKELFARAVAEEDYRQEFVDAIARPEHVSEISYEGEQIEGKGYSLAMRTEPHLESTRGYVGYPAGIFVYPSSFDPRWIECSDDFLSTLEDHEFYHAWELFHTPDRLRVDFNFEEKLTEEKLRREVDKEIKSVGNSFELRAHLYQIGKLKGRNCSSDYIRQVNKGKRFYLDALNELGVTNIAELIAPFKRKHL